MLRVEDQVIQRYISDPLLIDGKKHDLRLYLLIAKTDPFLVFLNEEGLARFCTENYQKPSEQKDIKREAHLTNYSINKSHPNFKRTNKLTEINNASKRTLASYWKSVEQEGHDVQTVRDF